MKMILIAITLALTLSACGGGSSTNTVTIPVTVITYSKDVVCPNGKSSTGTSTIDQASATTAANNACPVADTAKIVVTPTNGNLSISPDTLTVVSVDTDSDLGPVTATSLVIKAGQTAVIGTVSLLGKKGVTFTFASKAMYSQKYDGTVDVVDTLGRHITLVFSFTTSDIPLVDYLYVASNDPTYGAPLTIINTVTSETKRLVELNGLGLSCWGVTNNLTIPTSVGIRCAQQKGGATPYWTYFPNTGVLINKTDLPVDVNTAISSGTAMVTVGMNVWTAEGRVSGPTTANTHILINKGGITSTLQFPTDTGFIVRMKMDTVSGKVWTLTSTGVIHRVDTVTEKIDLTLSSLGQVTDFFVQGGKVYSVNGTSTVFVNDATDASTGASLPSFAVTGTGPTNANLQSAAYDGTSFVFGGADGLWKVNPATLVTSFTSLEVGVLIREIVVTSTGEVWIIWPSATGTKVTNPLSSNRKTFNVTGAVKMADILY